MSLPVVRAEINQAATGLSLPIIYNYIRKIFFSFLNEAKPGDSRAGFLPINYLLTGIVTYE